MGTSYPHSLAGIAEERRAAGRPEWRLVAGFGLSAKLYVQKTKLQGAGVGFRVSGLEFRAFCLGFRVAWKKDEFIWAC